MPGRDAAVAGAAHAAQGLLQLVDQDHAGRHRVGDPQRLPRPLLRLADQRAHQRADVQEQRGPARLVAQGLRAGRLARARRPEQQHAAGPDVGPPPRPQGAGAERLEGLQPAQVGERLAAAVQGQQAALLQRLGLELPEDVRRDPVVPDQREAEGVLGLDAGQPGRRVEHGGQAVALGQLAGLGGDAAGDPLELVAAGQVVLDDDEAAAPARRGSARPARGRRRRSGPSCRRRWPSRGPGRPRCCSGTCGSCGARGSRCRRGWPSSPASGWPTAGRWR